MAGITYLDENNFGNEPGTTVKLDGMPPFPCVKIGSCFMLLAYCDVDPGPGTRHEGMFIFGPKKERAKLIEEWNKFYNEHDESETDPGLDFRNASPSTRELISLLRRFKEAQDLATELREKAARDQHRGVGIVPNVKVMLKGDDGLMSGPHKVIKCERRVAIIALPGGNLGVHVSRLEIVK